MILSRDNKQALQLGSTWNNFKLYSFKETLIEKKSFFFSFSNNKIKKDFFNIINVINLGVDYNNQLISHLYVINVPKLKKNSSFYKIKLCFLITFNLKTMTGNNNYHFLDIHNILNQIFSYYGYRKLNFKI